MLKWDNIKRHQKLPLLLHAGRQWLAPTWVLPTAGLGTQRLCWVTFSALHCAHKTKRLRSEQALPFWSRSLWAQSTRPSLSLSPSWQKPIVKMNWTYLKVNLWPIPLHSPWPLTLEPPRSFSTAPDFQASFWSTFFFWPPPPAADTTQKISDNLQWDDDLAKQLWGSGLLLCCDLLAPISTVFVSEEGQRFQNSRPSNCHRTPSVRDAHTKSKSFKASI